MLRSNLLSIKCNGSPRYPRDYASNSLGTLHRKFKSSQSNCGFSMNMHILPLHPITSPLHLRQRESVKQLLSFCSQRVGRMSAKCWPRFWRCAALTDTPHRSPVRSDSSRCKRRVIPPSRFTLSLSLLSLSHHRRVNQLH